MALGDMESLDTCLHLDDDGQNRAIYCILKQIEAGQEIDRMTVDKLENICRAVESLTESDLKRGVKWNFLDKVGVSVLGLLFSIIGGAVVLILNCIINPK